MGDIFSYGERQAKMKEREKRVDDIIKFGKEKSKTIYYGTKRLAKSTTRGIMNYNPNSNKLFSGGAKPSVSAAKRFASSGNSPLHAKGSFEDAKKRFGKFD